MWRISWEVNATEMKEGSDAVDTCVLSREDFADGIG